jgi:PIN domain nuclease of toxin-antitoxin system
MKLLLDTHIFLWYVNGDKKLSTQSRSIIENADEVYVSSASLWEVIIKVSLKKLEVNIEDLVESISLSGFVELPITIDHTVCLQNLPDHHRDPFDRILIAQAIAEPLSFMTADESLKGYSKFVEFKS